MARRLGWLAAAQRRLGFESPLDKASYFVLLEYACFNSFIFTFLLFQYAGTYPVSVTAGLSFSNVALGQITVFTKARGREHRKDLLVGELSKMKIRHELHVH